MLSDRQNLVLEYLKEEIAVMGFCPTIREAASALGLSTDMAWRTIVSLEKMGAVKRVPDRARALKILAA